MEKKLLTLVVAIKEGQVLLGMKKRGFGAGRWNGFGGKVEAGETLEAAAIRETEEEAAITLEALEASGVLTFQWVGKPEVLEVHVFKTTKWHNDPSETEEMRPKWFSFEEIPYKDMWSDDPHWLPLLIEGKKFKGSFVFDENDQVLSHEIEIVS